MNGKQLLIRKTFVQVEEVRQVAGRSDDGGPLRKVAVCAVVANPFAGLGYVEDLSPLVHASEEIGTFLGAEAGRLLSARVESYGKGGIVGTGGEQEHVNAALTSVFGNAFRASISGGRAWITSATKVAGIGDTVDIPLAFKDDVWVRSHYDAIEVRIPGAPLPDELVIIAAVSNRGRINARVGGMTLAESLAKETS